MNKKLEKEVDKIIKKKLRDFIIDIIFISIIICNIIGGIVTINFVPEPISNNGTLNFVFVILIAMFGVSGFIAPLLFYVLYILVGKGE